MTRELVTPEMIEAGRKAYDQIKSDETFRRIYTAMHSSLPNPEGMTEARLPEGQVTELRLLVEESLFHLRNDRAAESYHHRALAALASTRVEPDADTTQQLHAAEKRIRDLEGDCDSYRKTLAVIDEEANAEGRKLVGTAASDDDAELVEIIEKRLTANVVSLAAACEMGRGAAAAKTVAKRIAASIAERISSRDDGLRPLLSEAEQFLDKANALALGEYRGSVPVLAARLAEVRDRARTALAQGSDRHEA
jgi:hypothetical protein